MGKFMMGMVSVALVSMAFGIYRGEATEWAGFIMLLNAIALACFAFLEGVDNV